MSFIILILIYIILYYLFFSEVNFSKNSLRDPLILLVIFSIVFLIISILFGFINNYWGTWEDIESYKNWMKALDKGRDIGKDPSFSIILNLFNFSNFGYDFTVRILLPFLIIFIYLSSLFIILPQCGLAIISGFFLILPAQSIQESMFSMIRYGLATSFCFLFLSLTISLIRKNSNLKKFIINKSNLFRFALIIILISLSFTTHIGTLLFSVLIILSILFDFVSNLIFKNFKNIPFFIKFPLINLMIFIVCFYVFNQSEIDISFLIDFPGFYRLKNYIVQISLDDISSYVSAAPLHRAFVYLFVFTYFYIVNSIVRFQYPTNINKLANILSIFSVICLIIVFSPFSLLYPLIIRITSWALLALAFTSTTLNYRFFRINNLSTNKNYNIFIKKPSFILMNLFSIYLLISFINN